MVTEQLPAVILQVVEVKTTEPEPLCDQLNLPAGEYPVTVALQVTFVDEEGTLRGLQDTTVLEVAGLTVTVAGAEVTTTDAPSVTCSSKLQVPTVVKAPVETDGFAEVVQPAVNEPPKALKPVADGDFPSHWQAYGDVPLLNETVVESAELWPTVMVPGLSLIVGGASIPLTVTSWAAELVVSEAGEPSTTVAQYHAFPVSAGETLKV
jgi:hypothetical protein